MASSAGEEAVGSSPVVPNAPPLVTAEAKTIVATGHGDCQQLSRDMQLSKEDASTMVVVNVMASSNQPSTLPNPPPSPAMDYRLLAVAYSGSFEDLKSLLSVEDLCQAQASNNGTIRSSALPRASDDEEAFLRESLLDGVTSNGDTLLHVVATNGDSEDFLNKAGLIHRKALNLLFVQNNKGDTPLHCAARAANSQMVFLLVDLAKGQDNNDNRSVKALLEKENKIKETALHEAIRGGNNDIVKMLMEEHPRLARLPKDGTSPLYLAILRGNKTIAETLYQMSDKILSYSGPNGQNALHAAIFGVGGKDLTEMLLEWNKDLTIQQDEKGNTPLHFAASVIGLRGHLLLLLQANPNAIYQQDHSGSFPIHVAASVGATQAITDFLENSPNCAGLRDAKGRTFLHVAVDEMEVGTVGYACRNKSLSWILNMQDKNGNTALHLAVETGSLRMFSTLLGNREVHLNLTNEKGNTPRDIASYNIPNGLLDHNQSSEEKIYDVLRMVDAEVGIRCWGYSEKKDNIDLQARKMDTKNKNEVIVKDATQSLCIGSVLIATVTFGASFTMPGGYRADDHTNGGTPTLGGKYVFDAFTVANTLAFTSSTMATISLMSSRSPIVDTGSRIKHVCMAFLLMLISVTSLVTAFALGTYMILAPVAYRTAVAVCVLSSLVLVYQHSELALKNAFCVPSYCRRKGICSGTVWTSLLSVLYFATAIIFNAWPIVVTFCLTTALNYPVRKVEQEVQPPTPLA